MNNNYSDINNFCEQANSLKFIDKNLKFGIAVNFLYISDFLKKSSFIIAAQNCSKYDDGSFTGETSAKMLSEIGVKMTIVGHSERRQLFFETNDDINKKIHLLIKNNILPILCIGETLKQYKNNETKKVLTNQILKCLDNVKDINLFPIIAYEPIWSIGSGKPASTEYIEKICTFIRKIISENFTNKISEKCLIQYGGSVNSDNISEILKLNNVDGALVGGASLKIESFLGLIKNA